MRDDIAPLISLALFIWSIWAFYSGQQALAYYLLGAAIYVTVAIATVFIFSVDTLADRIEKAIRRQAGDTT